MKNNKNHLLISLFIIGVTLYTENGVAVGESKIAAREGIAKVVLSRIGMGSPGMVRIIIKNYCNEIF